MRRKDEKTLFVIEIINLAFIVVISIFLQLIDSKIQDYNDKLMLLEFKRSESIQVVSFYQERVNHFDLIRAVASLGTRLLVEKPKLEEDFVAQGVDQQEKELINKYKNNELDIDKFLNEMSILNRKKKEHYRFMFKEAQDSILYLRKNPPKWFMLNLFLFKRICFIIQLVGALVAIMLFIGLHKQLCKRMEN